MLSRIAENKKQIIKFTLIGVFAVLVDMGSYYLLLGVYPERLFGFISNEVLAKSTSFLTGTFVTYNLNKYWTWKQRDKSNKRIIKFILVYGFSLGMNVFTNTVLLYLLHKYSTLIDFPNKYFVAFIGATGLSASINFIGQKLWVFSRKK